MLAKYKELLSNTAVFAVGAFGSKILLFLLVPLYTNCMTASEYGIADLVSTTSTLVIPLVSLSIQEALFRFAFDKSYGSRELLKCFYLVVCIGSVVVLLLGLCFNVFSLLSGYELEFVLLSIVGLVRDAYALYVKASDKTRLFTLDALLYVVYLCGGNIVALVVLDAGILGYLYSMIIAKLLSLLFLFAFSKLPKVVVPIGVNWSLLKEMLGYSIPMVLNSISWWVMNYADRYIISILLGSASMGIFAVATRIPSLISTFVSVFNQSWAITSIKEFEGEKDESLYENVFAVFNCGVSLLTGFVLLIIHPFMSVYVGSDFRPAANAVPFLLLGALYLAYSSFFGIIFNSARKTKGLMSSSIWGALVNIALSLALVPWIGILGASIATAAAYCATFVHRLVHSRRIMSFNIQFKRFVLLNLLLLGMGVAQSLSSSLWPVSLALFAGLVLANGKDLKAFVGAGMSIVKKRREGK